MNTLYVSDLDGTLLNNKSEISPKSAAILNKLIKEGLLFTVATARTPATAIPVLKEVNINVPIIVMNGSFIYDIKEKKYIYTSQIPYESVKKVIDIVEKEQKQLFMYTLKEELLTVYYKSFNSQEEEAFYHERKGLELKKFVKVAAYPLEVQDKVGHMVMLDSYDVIKKIADQLVGIPGIKVLMYKDVNTENSYLLEISATDMNKAKGIQYVEQLLKIDKVVAFGDNLNDIEMLEAAEYGCAVGNAEEELKQIADIIIEANVQDSVAKFIEEDYYQKIA